MIIKTMYASKHSNIKETFIHYRSLHLNKIEILAARKIQSFVRMYFCKMRFRNELKRCNEAAAKI